MRLHVTGQREMQSLSTALNKAAAGLGGDLDAGSKRAASAIAREIRDHTNIYMPRGFERTFNQALKLDVEIVVTGHRRVTIFGSAKGIRSERRIKAMNEGILRHPVFGRKRRVRRHWVYRGFTINNPWVDQKIKPGWFDEPGFRAVPAAVRELETAVGKTADTIERAV